MKSHWVKRRNENGEIEKFYPITHKDAIIGLEDIDADTSDCVKEISASGSTITYVKGDNSIETVKIQPNEIIGQVSLNVLNWSDTIPYTQTISVQGVSETDVLTIECVANVSSLAEKKQLQKAWGMVDEIESGNGSITAYCYFEKPIATLPLIIRK